MACYCASPAASALLCWLAAGVCRQHSQLVNFQHLTAAPCTRSAEAMAWQRPAWFGVSFSISVLTFRVVARCFVACGGSLHARHVQRTCTYCIHVHFSNAAAFGVAAVADRAEAHYCCRLGVRRRSMTSCSGHHCSVTAPVFVGFKVHRLHGIVCAAGG